MQIHGLSEAKSHGLTPVWNATVTLEGNELGRSCLSQKALDLCVSARRRLSAVFVPGAEKLRRTSNQPAALLDSGAAHPSAGSSLPSFSGEAGGTPEAKGRAAVVIERSSSGECGDRAGI